MEGTFEAIQKEIMIILRQKEFSKEDDIIKTGIIVGGAIGTGSSINKLRNKVKLNAKNKIKSSKEELDTLAKIDSNIVKFDEKHTKEMISNKTNPMRSQKVEINGKKYEITEDNLHKMGEYNKEIEKEIQKGYNKQLNNIKREVRKEAKKAIRKGSLKRAGVGLAATGAALGGYKLYKKSKKK